MKNKKLKLKLKKKIIKPESTGTIIIRNDIRLNEKTGRYNDFGVIRVMTRKPIIYLGHILEYIDMRETTAYSPFIEIKFLNWKDENNHSIFIEFLDRIQDKDYYKKLKTARQVKNDY